MSSRTLDEYQRVGGKALAQTYGPPVPGGSAVIVLSAADQVFELTPGMMCAIIASGGDCLYSVGAAGETAGTGAVATNPANTKLILAGGNDGFVVPSAGATLHVVAGPTAGGKAYIATQDDVG